MSRKHPIVAITGSSGAGTTTVRHAFAEIFRREGIQAAWVEGDSFRRYDRREMRKAVEAAIGAGEPISHFGPEANLFDKMEDLFRSYSHTGTGLARHYVQQGEGEIYAQEPGTLTPWETLPPGSDLLIYEGLHGGVVVDRHPHRRPGLARPPMGEPLMEMPEGQSINVARWVDLLIGVVPIVNLEWIQKIHRDCAAKGRSPESVTATILRRLHDYVNFIVPQFSLTDINFQRVPLVDTSNPFVARDIPTADESIVVIRFRDPRKLRVEFPPLVKRLKGSFMSRRNTIVVPGGQMGHAMELICTPLIQRMLEERMRLEG
jgi:phosphoribulokinase